MKRRGVLALVVATAVTACGGKESDSPMADMTAEEHARMQAGGTQGAVDSAGMVMRQAVHLTPAQERALGVVYTTVTRRTLERSVRTVGEIQAAEDRVVDVTPKIEGFVERLFVNTTGETVRPGQALLALYSPALVAAQEEFVIAQRLVARVDSSAEEAWQAAQAMLSSVRRRLAYWDITEAQIEQLETTGEVTKTLRLASPVGGVVLEKDVLEGQRVMPGQRLYRIANLTEVWVEGEVFEQDVPLMREGAQAHIEVTAYPGEHLMGRVSFVHPTVDIRSRTNRVRVTVPNPALRLKPGMFATIYVDAVVGTEVMVVPMASVVVTGERNVVFVRDEEGRLAPREVVLGPRAGDLVQVLSGVQEGETIVASANFLVDAESRLGSTGGAMPGMQHGAVDDTTTSPPPAATEHGHD